MKCDFCGHEVAPGTVECPYCHYQFKIDAQVLSPEERDTFEGVTIDESAGTEETKSAREGAVYDSGADAYNETQQQVPPNIKVHTFGCGSGILFIGGMLLGAKEAYAVDIEENATRIAKENAAENHLNPENYTISCGNIITDTALRESIGSGYDVITANIVADVIKGMAPLFPSFLKDNGILILSGIITERADEVLDTVTAYDFAVLERREASGWCAVKLQKLAGAGTCCDTLRK